MSRKLIRIGMIACLTVLWPGAATGYEILLDIDQDDDPTTLNTLTHATTATVRIVLAPTEPGEPVDEINFGLGGTCWECDGVFDYGTSFDLFPPGFGDWTDHPDLVGTWDGAVCSLCCGNPGFHYIYTATAVGEPLVLFAPVFIATFSAWKSEPMFGWCPVPPSNLAAFALAGPGDPRNYYWNYIQIGGEAPLPVLGATWGRIKRLYE